VLFEAATNVTSLSADGSYVLWTTSDGGVFMCGTGLCAPFYTVATGRPQPTTPLRGSDNNVYWAEDAGQGPAFCPRAGCNGPPSYVGGSPPAALLTLVQTTPAEIVWLDTSLRLNALLVPDASATFGIAPGPAVAVTFLSSSSTTVFWANDTLVAGVLLDSGAPSTFPTPNSQVGGLAGGGPVVWTDESGVSVCAQSGCKKPGLVAGPPDAGWVPGAVARGGPGGSDVFWSGIQSILYCTVDKKGACVAPPAVIAPTGVTTVTVLVATSGVIYWVEPAGIMEAKVP
jgi:hypothetical protein